MAVSLRKNIRKVFFLHSSTLKTLQEWATRRINTLGEYCSFAQKLQKCKKCFLNKSCMVRKVGRKILYRSKKTASKFLSKKRRLTNIEG